MSVVKRRGAVAVLDALGFKHLMETCNQQDIIEKMRRVKHRIDDAKRKFTELHQAHNAFPGTAKFFVDYMNFSDTIVLMAEWRVHRFESWPGMESYELSSALGFLGLAIAGLAQETACAASDSAAPPIAYRGAISLGEFTVVRNLSLVLGPALVDAAGFHEKPDGAFVVLTPSAVAGAEKFPMGNALLAQKILDDRGVEIVVDNSEWKQFFVRYAVPLKKGAVDTYAINPLLIPELRPSALAGFTQSFRSKDRKVRKKWKNTEAFLTFCNGWSRPG
jgi:hypothetical protein